MRWGLFIRGARVPIRCEDLRTEVCGHVTEHVAAGDGVKLWRRFDQRLAEGALAGTEGG